MGALATLAVAQNLSGIPLSGWTASGLFMLIGVLVSVQWPKQGLLAAGFLLRKQKKLAVAKQVRVCTAHGRITLSGNVLSFAPQVESHVDFSLPWDALRLEITCVHLDDSLRAFVTVDAATLAPRETWIGSDQAVCRVTIDDRMSSAIRELDTAGTMRIGHSLQMRVRFVGFKARGGDMQEVKGGTSEIVTLCNG